MSSLLWVDDSHLEGALLFLVFLVICYFHQIAMSSVIKLCRVVGLADLHGVSFFSVYFLCTKLWFECRDFGLILFVIWMIQFLGYG